MRQLPHVDGADPGEAEAGVVLVGADHADEPGGEALLLRLGEPVAQEGAAEAEAVQLGVHGQGRQVPRLLAPRRDQDCREDLGADALEDGGAALVLGGDGEQPVPYLVVAPDEGG